MTKERILTLLIILNIATYYIFLPELHPINYKTLLCGMQIFMHTLLHFTPTIKLFEIKLLNALFWLHDTSYEVKETAVK